MPQHKEQRVGVFVDVQNMYYSAKQFYHAKVNFAHILKKAVAGRQLIRAIAYVIKADIKEESNFFDALEKIGYDVRSKDLQTFYTGAKKGDWDVGIAMDIMRMANKLDVIVLCSGDGDFKDLLEHVKALGCRAEVIAFGKTASSRILSQAEDFYDLGKELDKALIKDFSKPDNKQDNKNEIIPEAIEGESKPIAVSSAPKPNFVPKTNFVNNHNKQGQKPSFNNNNKKPFVKRDFKSFDNKRSFQKPGFQRDEGRDDQASFMQRINMDQPLPEPKPVNQQPKRFEPVRPTVQGQRPPQRPPMKPVGSQNQKAVPPVIGKLPTKPVEMPQVKQESKPVEKKEASAVLKPAEKKQEIPKEKKADSKPKKPKEKKPKAIKK